MAKAVNVTVEDGGFVLEASHVIPEVLECGELTPYPNYTFSSFVLKTVTSDLTTVQCDYVVNGIFKGSFNGSYCTHYQVAA